MRMLDRIYFELTGLRLTKRGERVRDFGFLVLIVVAFCVVGTIESR